MNYTTLRATVADYLHRGDLTGRIPFFIELAESRLSAALRSAENELSAVVDMAATPAPLPADFVQPSSFATGGAGGPRELLQVTPTRMAQVKRIGAGFAEAGAGVFTIIGKTFDVFPFTAPKTVTITYWSQVPALSDTAPSNPVLTRWPQLYLYGALVEGYSFTAQPEARAEALATFLGELGEANRAAIAAKFGPAPSIQAG
jgi:hypothetical protein